MIRRIKSRVKYYEGQRVLILDRRTRHYGRFGTVSEVLRTKWGCLCWVKIPRGAGLELCHHSDLATEAEVRLATQEGDA